MDIHMTLGCLAAQRHYVEGKKKVPPQKIVCINVQCIDVTIKEL